LNNSNLQVYITEVSIQKGSVRTADADGCPITPPPPDATQKFYAVVKYAIYNSGSDDFLPATTTSGYIGEAECHKPAIFKFLSLDGLISGVKLIKYATCVLDDELAGDNACIASASGMKIRSGKSYGRSSEVSVKFAITDADFANFFTNVNPATILDLKLTVNPLISNGVVGEVHVAKGTELASHNWLDPMVFPDPVVLYAAPKVVINNLQLSKSYGDKYINLAEVQLFYNNVQLPPYSLRFTFSSTLTVNGVLYSANKCNDGDVTDLCHTNTGDPDPTLTIVSSAPFDKVVVYNRADGDPGVDRIEGATMTTTIDGQSKSTVFPQSADLIYTFLVQTTGLTLYYAPSYASTASPTIATTAAPTSSNQVVITNLQNSPAS